MSSKQNTYGNRFSKALNFEPQPDAPKDPLHGNGNGNGNGNGSGNGNGNGNGSGKLVFPLQNKIGGIPENGLVEEKTIEATASGRLKQPTGFSQLLETWSIGKPAAPSQEIEKATAPATSNGAKRSEIQLEIKTEITGFARRPPVCQTIEIDVHAVEPHLVAIRHPRSPHSEEYRSLRTNLLHTAERRRRTGKELQAIVVASARPSEGKSTTALNLAWLMAQTDGVSALLIDADLRMPSLADYLGVEDHPGLSDVFEGTTELEQAIVKLNPSGLHFLPGGSPRDDVAELLSGNAFRRILDKARTMFDYIIIDAPPLAIFTDAAVLINIADGAMLVVKANKTRYGTINRILETVPREQMLGVVLNASKDEMSESHYNYYYDYANKKKVQKPESAN